MMMSMHKGWQRSDAYVRHQTCTCLQQLLLCESSEDAQGCVVVCDEFDDPLLVCDGCRENGQLPDVLEHQVQTVSCAVDPREVWKPA